MFKILKEKISNWSKKIKEEFLKKTEEKRDIEKISRKETDRKTKIKKSSKKEEEKKVPTEEEIKKLDEKEIKKEEKKSFLSRFFKLKEEKAEEQLRKIDEKDIKAKETKESLLSKIFKKELTEEKFEEIFKELEITLLENNVAFEIVEKIKEELKLKVIGKKDYNLEEEIKKTIESVLIEPDNFIEKIKNSLKEKKPYVILFVGINGTGKTTTLAKIAYLLLKNKLSVCIAAADTYRAASIEQLEEHAKNLNVPIIKKDYGTDAASVGFEAIQYAKKNNIDVVLIDSAGRLNNKESLMKELEKISRVNNPDMKIFVGESITGNDSIEQAKAFDEKINITGSILSKADVDEKGGTILSIGYITKKPILFLGVGQKYEDLEEFNKRNILERLGL
ncbi:MAG: signal recognition particle-docking protein FtsY [Candidatus Pacearchaeota archaeon]